jgi:transcriptional regulator with PAS, ATPase and Fis domain
MKGWISEFHPNHNVEFLNTDIDKSDLQNYTVIESQLRSIIQQIDASHELHIIAGTGPTAFGMAWCTLHIAMHQRFQLYALQKPEYTGDINSTLKEIKPVVSQLLDDTLREFHTGVQLPENIFSDEIIQKEYMRAAVYAKAIDINVLILGETGCGKDRMAEFIHKNSPIYNRVYKAINCASLHDEVLYSELFGHKKGAFTGAIDNRTGLLEECNGGTLFLDEIGDISPFMQQSLLRAIENKEIKQLGSNEIKRDINVRIIAATNANLYEKCREGRFRWDLYYRLSSPEIVLQNYRSRTEIHRKAALTHYIKLLEKKWGRTLTFSKEAQQLIERYSFPGNFREIFNTLNSLFVLNAKEIAADELPARFRLPENEIDESYEFALRQHCIRIYSKYEFDLAKTKKALGYGNSTQLKNKFIEWGVYRE